LAETDIEASRRERLLYRTTDLGIDRSELLLFAHLRTTL